MIRTRTEHAQHIAQITQRLLENQNLSLHERTVFYVLILAKRVILIFDPLALRHPERVVNEKFTHGLSTALGGCRVVPTNSRGLFLQVAYTRPQITKLETQSLDLSQQPGALHVPIGQTQRGPLWLSIVDMDSVLIGGTRRMGKTNLLHTWILSLIEGGETLLVLWDGKDGTEFGRYNGQSNLLYVDDLADGLQHLTGELARRKTLFKAMNVNALPAYNAKSKAKLAPLALIVDEAALIPDDLQGALSRIIAVGGAYGVHPVIATQRPDADAVQSVLKANLATRIALPVASHHDSQVILGHTGAEKLPKTKGRLLMIWEARKREAQAYLAPINDMAPQTQPEATLLTGRELKLAQAAFDLGGWFRIKEIADETGESRDWVNAVAQRWERMGYLTPVQRNEQGHQTGRRMTEILLQTAGLGGLGDQAD
jgi:hypothetical protein